MEQDDIARYLNCAIKTRTPLSASLELTRRCNFRCVHCYLGNQEAIHKYRKRELSTEAVFSLLDEMVKAGTLFLTLTGGDPMLRPDFIRIYEYAVRIGLLVSVYCNGSLVTKEVVNSFRKFPPRIVEITLYGATKETFESVTQKPGSFVACMEGILLLRRENLRLRLKTMVLTLNYQEVPTMRKIARDMEIQFRHDCSVISALAIEDNAGESNVIGGSGLRDTLRFRLSPMQASAVDISSNIVKEKIIQVLAQENFSGQRTRKLYGCGAGRNSFHITPYGRMQPCLITSEPFIDLTSDLGNFLLSWGVLSEKFTALEAKKDFICSSCNNREICTGCPSGFLGETGFHDKVPSFYCDYAECRRIKSQR